MTNRPFFTRTALTLLVASLVSLGASALFPSSRGVWLDGAAAFFATLQINRFPRLGSGFGRALFAGGFAAGIDALISASLGVAYSPVAEFRAGPLAAPLFALAFGLWAALDRHTELRRISAIRDALVARP